MQVAQIKKEIKQLPQQEYIKLRKWFAEEDWRNWDKQIENDLKNGSLDFLVEEGMAEKSEGKLRQL